MKNKNNNLITYIIVALVVMGGGFLIVGVLGNNDSPSIYSSSVLAGTEESFDFGTISMEEGDVAHSFEIKNEGEESLRIRKVYTSCMCTKATVIDSSGRKYKNFSMPGHGVSSKTNIEVPAGEIVVVEAVFDPAAHGPSGVGLVQRSIYLETDSAKSPKLELSFQAMVTR